MQKDTKAKIAIKKPICECPRCHKRHDRFANCPAVIARKMELNEKYSSESKKVEIKYRSIPVSGKLWSEMASNKTNTTRERRSELPKSDKNKNKNEDMQTASPPSWNIKTIEDAQADRITNAFMILFDVLNKQINLNDTDYHRTKSMLVNALCGENSEKNLPKGEEITALEMQIKQKEIDHRNEVERINKRINELKTFETNGARYQGSNENRHNEYTSVSSIEISALDASNFPALTSSTISSVLEQNKTNVKIARMEPNNPNLAASQQNPDKS